MQTLLVEPDPNIRLRWEKRLRESDLHVVAVGSVAEASSHLETTGFAASLFRWSSSICEHDDDRERIVELLKSHGGLVFCLHDGDIESVSQQPYRIGFDGCISSQCCDEELHVKLGFAKHLARLESRLAQAQKLESIGELAAGIAHEINTPIQFIGDNTRFVKESCQELGPILSECKRLLDAIDNSHEVDSVAESLRRQLQEADIDYLLEEMPSAIDQSLDGVERVSNIVRAMKEFAHPGGSEMTLTDLTQAIENTLMVARNEWKYVADLATKFHPNLPAVPCLPGEISQVILNLVVNASHAIAAKWGDSPESKGTITVTTSCTDTYAEIRIGDNGAGIDQDDFDRIFHPFYTTKSAGQGTGQGLAIARAVIVERHRGSINVESVKGEGTTFVVRLPLTQEPVDSAATHEQLIEA